MYLSICPSIHPAAYPCNHVTVYPYLERYTRLPARRSNHFEWWLRCIETTPSGTETWTIRIPESLSGHLHHLPDELSMAVACSVCILQMSTKANALWGTISGQVGLMIRRRREETADGWTAGWSDKWNLQHRVNTKANIFQNRNIQCYRTEANYYTFKGLYRSVRSPARLSNPSQN